jgi:hypothetical protein
VPNFFLRAWAAKVGHAIILRVCDDISLHCDDILSHLDPSDNPKTVKSDGIPPFFAASGRFYPLMHGNAWQSGGNGRKELSHKPLA